MAEQVLALVASCPDGHSFETRRTCTVWRLGLASPALVLWCHVCGLEWNADDVLRTQVRESLSRLSRMSVPGE